MAETRLGCVEVSEVVPPGRHVRMHREADIGLLATGKTLKPKLAPTHPAMLAAVGTCGTCRTTRNVALARAMTTSLALIRLCAKQIVPPVLMTSPSTTSHCPISAVPMKSTASEMVASHAPPSIACAQL